MKKIKNSLRAIDKIFASAGSWVTSKTTDYTMEKRPDSSRQKLLVDCTYLYSTNINTGIQRVVRNIIRNLEPYTAKKNMELYPVALVNGTFIRLDSTQIIHFQKKMTWFALATRIKRKIQLYFTSLMPTEKLYQEDIVLMLDSSWYLPIWPSLHYAKKRGAKIITVTYFNCNLNTLSFNNSCYLKGICSPLRVISETIFKYFINGIVTCFRTLTVISLSQKVLCMI